MSNPIAGNQPTMQGLSVRLATLCEDMAKTEMIARDLLAHVRGPRPATEVGPEGPQPIGLLPAMQISIERLESSQREIAELLRLHGNDLGIQPPPPASDKVTSLGARR